jgi:phosphomannomutase
MKIDSKIFKPYDIRGVYPNEFNEKIAYKAGVAFVRFLKDLAKKQEKHPIDTGKGKNKGGKKISKDKTNQNLKIVVGRDLRRSSKPISKAFVGGIIDSGVDVLDVGVVTTPMSYFAISKFKADAGAMITASHNPQKYNGIKMTKRNTIPISGEDLAPYFKKKSIIAKQKGEYRQSDVADSYLGTVVKGLKLNKKIKVSLHCNGGVAKLFLPRFIKMLGVKEVKTKPDISICFDYDSDRLIVRDGKGNLVRGDIIGLMIADEIARRERKVIYGITCTRLTPVFLRNKGASAIPSAVGHTKIKNLMKKQSAFFGMEMSGHYYFKEFNFFESPFFALRKLLEYLDKRSDKKFTELVEEFIKFSHSGEINFKGISSDKFDLILEKLKETYISGAVNTIDGITVEFSNWWFNLRKSNTEDVIRLVVEANKPELMEERVKELSKIIKSA